VKSEKWLALTDRNCLVFNPVGVVNANRVCKEDIELKNITYLSVGKTDKPSASSKSRKSWFGQYYPLLR